MDLSPELMLKTEMPADTRGHFDDGVCLSSVMLKTADLLLPSRPMVSIMAEDLSLELSSFEQSLARMLVNSFMVVFPRACPSAQWN